MYYFSILVISSKRNFYMISWINDLDGVVTENGKLSLFDNKTDLLDKCRSLNIELKFVDDFFKIDLDDIKTMLSNNTFNSNDILTAWNLLDDICRSLSKKIYKRTKNMDILYDKIFWSSNLPSVTPKGEKFEPSWTNKEIYMINKIIDHLLHLIEEINAKN